MFPFVKVSFLTFIFGLFAAQLAEEVCTSTVSEKTKTNENKKYKIWRFMIISLSNIIYKNKKDRTLTFGSVYQ